LNPKEKKEEGKKRGKKRTQRFPLLFSQICPKRSPGCAALRTLGHLRLRILGGGHFTFVVCSMIGSAPVKSYHLPSSPAFFFCGGGRSVTAAGKTHERRGRQEGRGQVGDAGTIPRFVRFTSPTGRAGTGAP
jgi:hypothetical protein